ncbi:hypothetical protein SAMN02746065_104156 [Desulfocicer vacuolatum DSM 3385]|uniref:Uncharacterized protein n=1 Tax=Desulfocicer vacuolatum DSM 3385 TaxID=1121400 RepID=A0A1W2A5L7_9BACT|nr:hypothetical protein [Desulfocicer vacuolatum]SMC55985.1 hypothetical protein SAMN02746065_104156 [Desulfocicer vacuolatum DSM 3385]
MQKKEIKELRTCVTGEGVFKIGIHTPSFFVDNFREHDYVTSLGSSPDGRVVTNHVNFPKEGVSAPHADTIYEIPNAFPFKGTTYINSRWADATAENIENIALSPRQDTSLWGTLDGWGRENRVAKKNIEALFKKMPGTLQIALAESSTDPHDLVRLAQISCTFEFDTNGIPLGLVYERKQGKMVPAIKKNELFEVVANNPHLPDPYKRAMVLCPGVQGDSAITAEWHHKKDQSHVFEYLRQNSYIPWGHFAANTADDTVRYCIADLSLTDMEGMRHLCYQRIYVMLARQMGIDIPRTRQRISREELEKLRIKLMASIESMDSNNPLGFNGSLWGWNFGFSCSQSGYRLHASHQQIHQQYAMIPCEVPGKDHGRFLSSYACGDMVADFIKDYRNCTQRSFFENYLAAIRTNGRVDGNENGPRRLEVFEDENILLFVPKAQTSQWELQMMPLRPCGNILEADDAMRKSLDRGIFIALNVLEKLGARMVTCLEYAKRFDDSSADQQLLYAFLPRLPHSPGAFSEAQLRWITGHYPEDFALACRNKLTP